MKKGRTVAVMLRTAVHYRREIFEEGLRRIGYGVVPQPMRIPNPGDVLVLWNRPRMFEAVARMYEKNGGIVLIAENGYIGRDAEERGMFALARSQHNGAGTWKIGGPERWEKMNVKISSWRENGDFVLVLPQRGIGSAVAAMPQSWVRNVMAKLVVKTKRPVRVRLHPGNDHGEPYKDLRGAWAAVTWGSGAAIKALAAGCPVFHEMRQWIGAPAARLLENVKSLEDVFLGDRLPMFQRLAWAQWSPVEIQNGEAFAWLLSK